MPSYSLIRATLGFPAVRRNYQNLALSVLDHALRDATGTRVVAPDTKVDAKDFIDSGEAEFWAEAAGVNIWKLREVLRERLGARD
jgi:hypothetical protein